MKTIAAYQPVMTTPEPFLFMGDEIGIIIDKSMFWLEQSGHVVTRDQERQQVFEAALAFVRRLA